MVLVREVSEICTFKLADLERLINYIGRAQTKTEMISDSRAFAELIRQSIDLGISPEWLAEEFSINRSSISRWANGKSAPQPYVRPKVAEDIAAQLKKLLEKETEAQAAWAACEAR